jgi:DNA-binding transcriptional regulator WhiA
MSSRVPPKGAIPKGEIYLMYSIKKNFFSSWSEPMAYVLGYFCANGCLYRSPQGYYTVVFSSSDPELLAQIQTAMGSDHKLHAGGTQLRIGSQELGEQLEKILSFTSNKNQNMSYPDIPDEWVSTFLRGYFDGNGSWIVEQGRRVISSITCPNEEFLGAMRDQLVNQGLTNANIHRIEDRGVTYMVRYFIGDTQRLHDLIYQGASIYSRRKRAHYDTGLKN